MTTSTTKPPTYYFAYGSNLWLAQMHRRCPEHKLIGTALLPRHRWHINTRGYANLVPTTAANDDHDTYGVVYTLSESDEAQLDLSEGVPYWYQRVKCPVKLLPSTASCSSSSADEGQGGGERVLEDVLVYMDPIRTRDGVPKEEYIHRINNGFRDAVGIPKEWVERYVRKYVPAGAEGMVEDPFLFKSDGEVKSAVEKEV
ncbi:Butirosin biosynthesis, BtrG-like protein [Tuber brumale]|nr:Butirosin biosynthesis, BtrG-like protein [Tuber brumale]